MHPACTGRKTGWVFVTGREQKACPFSESGGRYTSPRPSSFVPRWWVGKAANPLTVLARLGDHKAKPGGAVNGGAESVVHLDH